MTDPTHPDYSDLGAAAPLPASSRSSTDAGKTGEKRSTGASGGPDGSARRRRIGPVTYVVAGVTVAVLLALIPAISTVFVKTPRDKVGITYGGGPFEPVRFQKIIPPGSGLTFNGFFDTFYQYPADQMAYVLPSGDPDSASSRPAISAPSSDDVEVRFELSVHFKLNVDQLQDFHEEVGLRYEAHTDDGWESMLDAILLPQLRNSLQARSRNHSVADLYSDADLLVTLQGDVRSTLGTQLRETTGGDYFCSPTYRPGQECGSPAVVIKSIQVPRAVQDAFERVRVAELDVAARRSEAEASGILIDALGDSGDVYALLKAIESGNIRFWVLPDGGVSIAGPSAPEDDEAPAPEVTDVDGGG